MNDDKNNHDFFDSLYKAEAKAQRRLIFLFVFFITTVLISIFFAFQLKKLNSKLYQNELKLSRSYEESDYRKKVLEDTITGFIHQKKQWEEFKTLYDKNTPKNVQEKIKNKIEYTVYIQYKNQRNTANKILETLNNQGYKAPGIERVNTSPKQIRYFHDSEKEIAEKIKILIQDKHNINLTIIQININAPPKLIEVWL